MEGKIRAKEVAQPQLDEDGAPIEAFTSFGFDVPCKYQTANRNDIVDVGDGTFTQASFIITVKDMNFTAKHIQLINSRGGIVCEKDVKSLEVLEKIKRVKIVI